MYDDNDDVDDGDDDDDDEEEEEDDDEEEEEEADDNREEEEDDDVYTHGVSNCFTLDGGKLQELLYLNRQHVEVPVEPMSAMFIPTCPGTTHKKLG